MQEETLVLHNIFAEVALRFPGRVALQAKKDNQWQRLSYQELDNLSQKVAAFLIQQGFKKGDFAALILENRPEWPIIYLGMMRAGLSCVPLDPQLTTQEIRNLIQDSLAKIVFCPQRIFSQKIKEALQGIPTKAVILDSQACKEKDCLDFAEIENFSPSAVIFPLVYPSDIASLIYTSGTTGKPKGVLLSHANICSDFLSIQKINLVSGSDNFLSLLPLYHTYSFMVTLVVPLLLGATITYSLSFRAQELDQIIQEAKITIMAGVPQLLSLLHKAIFDKVKKIPPLFRYLVLPFLKFKLHSRLKPIRYLISGGARLEPKIGKDLSALGLKVIEGYGLTETSPVVTLNPAKKVKFGSVGKPLPDIQVKIDNPDREGVGQVLIRGANVFQGYFKQPELTSQAIRQGWFYSGDLGFMDKEGYLFLVGREKEVIVLGSGKNIYPEELEGHYLQSPYIKEICIINRKEDRFGDSQDALFAVVVPSLEYFSQKKESDVRIKVRWELENLSRDLPSYKHIMGFMLTREELPRTVLRKIKRYEVRQRFLEKELPQERASEERPSPEDAAILDLDIAQRIIRYLSGQLQKPVQLDSHLEIDLGIDSLSRVDLGLGLESLLKVKISEAFLAQISTVRELILSIRDLIESPCGMTQQECIQKSWGEILRESPAEETLAKIRLTPGILDKIINAVFKSLFLFIFRIFWLLRVEGKENLPSEGPYLICPNHASFLDGLFVFSSLGLRHSQETFFLGHQGIFEHPLLGWANKIARLLSVDTSTHLSEAMQAVSFVARHKKIVCIFPEGQRSVDSHVKEFKKGVGILIKELDITVIPVYIKGSHGSWPRTSRLPRFYPIKVIFGRPVRAKDLIKKAELTVGSSPDSYESIARQLREEVLKLACPNI